MAEIRLLTADDAAALSRLRQRAYETDPAAFAGLPSDDPSLDPAVSAERLRAGADGSSVVAGAFAPDLVGMLGIVCDQPARFRHKARLWGFYVEPVQRGDDLGRQLLSAVCAHAASRGVEQLYLQVAVECGAAIRTYERFGFETFGREPRALKNADGYSDELHMLLRLGEERGRA